MTKVLTMSTTEPVSGSLSRLSSQQSMSVVESSFTRHSTSVLSADYSRLSESMSSADITSYHSISPTSVVEDTSRFDSPSLKSLTQTESQSNITDKSLFTDSVSTSVKSTISPDVFPISDVSQLSTSTSVVFSPTLPSTEQLISSSTESQSVTSTFVASSRDLLTDSSVVEVVSDRLRLTAVSSTDVGASESVDLISSESSGVTSVLDISPQVSSTEDSLQESHISEDVSAATASSQSAYSTSQIAATVRGLPSLPISKRSVTTAATVSPMSSLASPWPAPKPSMILPSSTLSYLFSSATITSSMILSSPPTSSKPGDNSTINLPRPASQTESLYIIIPVCLVVLIMLAIVIIMCLRWRRQVKKAYVEPPPQDLWVNTHTEMAMVPAASTSTAPGVLVDSIIPFNPGDAVCQVLHPFPAQLENQISLREGDTIKILEKEGNGWWRGVNQAGESGWFPGSYVETIKWGLKNDDEKKKRSRVSSFLLKKKDSFLKKESTVDNIPYPNKTAHSENTELGIMTEVKNVTRQENTIENGTRYYAVYSYTAASKGEISLVEGELVMAQERDRNGWMRGKKLATGEVGWFPAVYVDEVQDVASLSSESTISGPVTYDQLNRNMNQLSNQDWIGLEHHALYSYVGEMPEDLSFDAGDKIIIYETSENGWWLGSKGKQVGWLPGTYVQLVEPVTEDESRSDTSSEDKFKSSSEDIIRTPDTENKPKPIRKAPPPPPKHKTSSSIHSKQESEANRDVPVDDDQTNDNPLRSNRYEPIKFQRLSSDSIKPIRHAPAPPGQKSPSVHVNINDKTETVPHSQNSSQQTTDSECHTLPNFEPPSSENFVTVSVSLPSRRLSTSSEKLQITPAKKPQIPRRFAKPKLHIRRKSAKLTNLAVNSRPSRPVPPRPPQPVTKPGFRSYKYAKKNISQGHSPVDDKPSIPNKDSLTNGTSNSDDPHISSSTMPPDIVLSSSGDPQYNVTNSTPRPALPLPPVPQELDILTAMSPEEQYNVSNRSTPPPTHPLPPYPQELEISNPSLEETTNTPHEPQFIPQLKVRKVIKVPPPIVPSKLQRPHINSDRDIITSSESQSSVVTHSDEHNNLKNQNILEKPISIISQSDTGVLKENRIQANKIETTAPESSSSKEPIISDNSNVKDLNSTSNEQHSTVEDLQKSVKSHKGNIVVNKPRYTVPPVKPPPPKSPPPRVQRMVRKTETADKSKKKTLWRAKRNYLATTKGELSFEEGSFIKEISKTLGQPGWCVGMLADGTTGLYHQSYVEESLIKEQSHV